MGKKLDYLMGKTFKTSKFKVLAKLAISRIAILNKQHNVRSSQARSDILGLLNLGHHQRALLRVEYVIKEQNILDLFSVIESHCQQLIQRVKLIQNKECPDELKEAISTLLFAASRCGEFPELQAIRKVLESWFGKEFVAPAAELCSPKIKLKFSARQSSIESKMKILEEIASENGITLHLEDDIHIINEAVRQEQQIELEPNISNSNDINELKDDTWDLPNIKLQEALSESTRARKKYKDSAAAAEEAFQSATYAAAAAKAAMELSLSESQKYDTDKDDDNIFNGQNEIKSEEYLKSDISIVDEKGEQILGFDKIHQTDNINYDMEVEEMAGKESNKGNKVRKIINDGSDDDDDENSKENIPLLDRDLVLDTSRSFRQNEHSNIKHASAVTDEDISNKDEGENDDINQTLNPLKCQADHMTRYSMRRSMSETTDSSTFVKQLRSHHSNLEGKPVSVRTRRLYSNLK